MFPAYIDPIAPGLAPAFAGMMRAELLTVGAAALVGVIAIVFLVLLDATRSRRRRRTRSVPTRATSSLRNAA
jgi:hypothetical protein